jgi:hypothetical protein
LFPGPLLGWTHPHSHSSSCCSCWRTEHIFQSPAAPQCVSFPSCLSGPHPFHALCMLAPTYVLSVDFFRWLLTGQGIYASDDTSQWKAWQVQV